MLDLEATRVSAARALILECDGDAEAILERLQKKRRPYIVRKILEVAKVYLTIWCGLVATGQDAEWVMESSQDLLTSFLREHSEEPLWPHVALWGHLFITVSILEEPDLSPLNQIEQTFAKLHAGQSLALRHLLHCADWITLFVLNDLYEMDTSVNEYWRLLERFFSAGMFSDSSLTEQYALSQHNYVVHSLYADSLTEGAALRSIEEELRALLTQGNEANQLLCRYYLAKYYFDQDRYDACPDVLDGVLDALREYWGDYCYANACHFIAFCSYKELQLQASQWATRARDAFPRSCIQALNNLMWLTYMYATDPWLDTMRHKQTATEFLSMFTIVMGDLDTSFIVHALGIASQYHDFGNMDEAAIVIQQVKSFMNDVYGRKSRWLEFTGYYEAMIANRNGKPAEAKALLDRAMRLMQTITDEDGVDSFTQYLVEHRQEWLTEYQNQYLQIASDASDAENTQNTRSTLDVFMDLMKNIIPAAQQSGNADVLYAYAAELYGVPKEHIEQMTQNGLAEKNMTIRDWQQAAHSMATLATMEQVSNAKLWDHMSDAQRLKMVDELMQAWRSLAELVPAESAFYRAMHARMMDMTWLMCRGYLKFGVPQKALDYLNRYENVLKNVGAQLNWQLLRCLAYDALQEPARVKSHLESALSLQRQLVSQILHIEEQDRQLSLLEQFVTALPICLYLLVRYVGKPQAYTFLLKNKALTMDYKHLTRRHSKMSGGLSEEDMYQNIFSEKAEGIFECLDEGDALIEFTVIWSGVETMEYYAFLLQSGERLEMVHLGDQKEIDNCIRRFRDAIENRLIWNKPEAIVKSAEFQALKMYLVSPVQKKLRTSVRKIYVAPEGALFRVPFDLFFSEDISSISYLFTGKDLRRRTEDTEAHVSPNRSLVIGVSRADGESDLPAASWEAQVVAASLRCDVWNGSDHLESMVWTEYDVIHIASHADFEANREQIMHTAKLHLHAGRIWSAKEIERQDFSASKLITLSACATGAGVTTSYEGLLGLSRAFMHAGAHNLLLSLWRVDDISTCILMRAFYERLGNRVSRIDKALGEAKEYVRTLRVGELRNVLHELIALHPHFACKLLLHSLNNYSDDACYFAHPYYWDSFVYFECA